MRAKKNWIKGLFRAACILVLLGMGSGNLFAQTNVVPDAVELQVLKNMYDSLGGATWINKSGWPAPGAWPASATAAQMDAWFGIVVTNGDITGLSFNRNGLTGQIPKTVSQLTRLTTLRFDNNQIAGTMPASLGTLRGLVTLYVNNNKLTGSIPGSLNSLTSLTHLYLSTNLFNGDIPNFGSLANLRELYLGVNNFTPGPIPTWVTGLTNLRILIMSSMFRNGVIPATIGNLTYLTNLQLQSNQLTGAIPSAIGNIGTLQYLYLFGNQLSGSLPPSIGNLSSLISLQAYSNQLSGAIPETIGNLTNLIDLQLHRNQFSGTIPSEIGNLTKLVTLFLHVNNLSGALPSSIGNLGNLVNLYVFNNRLSGPLPASLGNLFKLVQLQAYGNLFTGQIPIAYGNLANLQVLHLTNNQLSGRIPSELGNLAKLTQLYLNTNKFSGPIPTSLGNLTNLTHLYISANQLTGEIPTSLGNLTKMSYFYGGGNQLTGTIPSSFSNWSNIYLFDISAGKYSGALSDNLFSTWTKIVTFNIGNNNFTGSFPSSITSCRLLTSLAANINKFSSVPASILNLPVATSINFDNNELTSIPNFGNHVNKVNLTLTVSNNRLDFTHLEPLVGVGIKTLSSLVQKTINDVATMSLTTGSDFTMTARPKGSFTNNLKWEKLQLNGVTWSDISPSNANAITGVSYRVANATTAAEGTYRWSATSTKATVVTITSDPIIVKTTQRFTLDNLAFQYKYDGRKRMIAKKVPGAEWVFMVYDNRDRLVLTQDGEQRKFNRWTFTKYDALNRPVMTGIYTHGSSVDQGTMQGVVNTYYNQTPFPTTKAWFETYSTASNNVLLYDNKSFPSTGVSEATALTVTYYDNYLFKPLLGVGYNYVPSDVPNQIVNGVTYSQPVSENLNVIGLVTGTRTKMLSTGLVAGAGWVNSITYYDDKYRVVQNISDNQIGGYDRSTNVVDFVGKVLYSKATNQGGAIQWKDIYNVTTSANNIAGTNTSNVWGTSGAASKQMLAANTDGWLEVSVSELNTARMIGFSQSNIDANFNTIDYALYQFSNKLMIYEKGVPINNTGTTSPISLTISTGQVLRLERVGSVIRYLRNGTLVYTSTVPSTSPLVVDMALHHPGATLTNIRTSFTQPDPALTVARNFTYDHAGRLLKTFHSINGATPVLLAQNEYNELGQLVDKKLHSTDGTNFKQSVDYRYNIRGWLTRMNNANVKDAANLAEDEGSVMPDLFGMNLNYNNLVAGLTASGDEQYNGNISSISYSTNQSLGTLKERGYRFGYDPMNRLLAATHKEKSSGWNPSTSFHEDNFQYDLNGNIQKLNRKGANGSNMDVLTYGYGTANTAGNQLQTVSDGGELQAGFVDGNIGSTDYVYDLNGNMTVDRNKSITAIGYNHLNLPDRVAKSSGDYVKYIYDASGRKLSQQVCNTAGTSIKKTDYVGEYIYENDVLQFINHEEGRVTKGSTGKQLVPSPQLVPNGDASSTVGFGPLLAVGLASETQGAETYLKVTSNQATGTPGFLSNFIAVKPGKSYQYKFRGYRTTSTAYLYVTGEVGGNIVWATKLIPSGAGNEAWVTADFTVPANVSRIKVGAAWLPVTIGDIIYANKIELYEVDAINGMYVETEVPGVVPTEYQYHLKDHLGNVRVTFTTKQDTEINTATMETAKVPTEQGQFLNYNEAIKINATIFDRSHRTPDGVANTTFYSTRLTGGNTNAVNGLAKSLSVMPGDKVDVEVFAKYLDPNSDNWSTTLANFMASIAAGGGAPAGTIIDGNFPGSLGNNAFPFPGQLVRDGDNGTGPKAYLNYLLFDRDYVYKTGGFKRLTTAAIEQGTDVTHERLFFDNNEINITEAGYLYVWLSNENDTPVEVYFDDFKVTHTKSSVIASDDYYPGGAVFNSYTRENSVLNNIKFQETEWQDELGLNLYDFDARLYDPYIWRTPTQDPHAEYYPQISPYSFLNNNPVNFLDPTGMDAFGLAGSNDIATCPTCPNTPQYQPYIDDPNNNYIYDPTSGGVSILLDEVVVTDGQQASMTYAPPAPSFDFELPPLARIGAGMATVAAMTIALVLSPLEAGTGEAEELARINKKNHEEFIKRMQAKYIPAPKTLPGFPGAQRVKSKNQRARWKDSNGDILEWDSQHGEVEVYDKTGRNHNGAADPETGQIKPDSKVPGRTTDK